MGNTAGCCFNEGRSSGDEQPPLVQAALDKVRDEHPNASGGLDCPRVMLSANTLGPEDAPWATAGVGETRPRPMPWLTPPLALGGSSTSPRPTRRLTPQSAQLRPPPQSSEKRLARLSRHDRERESDRAVGWAAYGGTNEALESWAEDYFVQLKAERRRRAREALAQAGAGHEAAALRLVVGLADEGDEAAKHEDGEDMGHVTSGGSAASSVSALGAVERHYVATERLLAALHGRNDRELVEAIQEAEAAGLGRKPHDRALMAEARAAVKIIVARKLVAQQRRVAEQAGPAVQH